jgi:ribosomal protein S18 acetylase RimI-like enzyme
VKDPDIVIERATINDVADIAPLFVAYRVFYEQRADLALATTFLMERIEKSESVIFYARAAEDNYVGFTQLYPSFCSVAAKRLWILYDLFVTPDARGTGAGTALLNKARKFAQQTSATRIVLETARSNAGAQKLYESLGYEKETEYLSYALELDGT